MIYTYQYVMSHTDVTRHTCVVSDTYVIIHV